MPVSEKAIVRALGDVARRYSDGEWIAGNQPFDAPKPPGGFITLVGMRPSGRGVRSCAPNAEEPLDIDVTLRETYAATLQVEARGQGAFEAVARVIAGAKLEGTVNVDRDGGACLGFQSASEIRNLSIPIAQRWEMRASADLVFTVFSDFMQTVPSIQSIEVNGLGESQLIEVP